MSAPLTKDRLAYTLGNQTYIGPAYEDSQVPAVKPEKSGIAALADRLLTKVAEWRHRRQVMEEMAMMTDRELADIGLSRADLSRVFDPGFAADHVRGRDYIAY